MYIKSPFNWVGNKYKHLDKINEIVGGKEYKRVIEPFMGTGNILLNINAPAEAYIGSDSIPLLPRIYSYMKKNKQKYVLEELEEIIKGWCNFSDNDTYYVFRDYWNSKYVNCICDKEFIYETVLLLKMCSNSMVRFNSKGEFNTGFRGLEKSQIEFFNENKKNDIIIQLNALNDVINTRNFSFVTRDFKDILEQIAENDLLVLDPPYILRTDMYNMRFTKEDDDYLLNFLSNTKNDFIYFNYLERDGEINVKIEKLLENTSLKVECINDKTLSGQGRKGTKNVKEVIITNIT